MNDPYWLTHKKKTGYSLKNSFEKELSYINAVITEETVIETEFGIYTLKPYKTFKIHKSLFYSYSCLDYPGCKICCFGFWGFFLKQCADKEIIKKASKEVSARINGKSFKYFAEDHHKNECNYLNNKGCSIHTKNPITCLFPLTFFDVRNDIVIIKKRMYGRNWALKCPVSFDTSKKDNQILERFYRFKSYMGIINIPHRLDYIIETIKSNQTRGFNL